MIPGESVARQHRVVITKMVLQAGPDLPIG